MTYKIKQSSPFLFAVTLLTVIFAGAAIIIFLSNNQILPKTQPLVFILCFVPVIGLAFYLPRFTATADILITIDNEGVSRQWLSQFIFHGKANNDFKWTNIEDYVVQPDRQFDKFKLQFKDGTKFQFYHNNEHDGKDDFKLFLSDFVQRVEQLNRMDGEKPDIIKLGKTIYETNWGLFLALFALLLILGLPIMLFIFPHKGAQHSSNFAMLGASYIGAIYYLIQVYSHRKKRKEYENSFK